MPTITLPDGSRREFEQAVSVYDVAVDIGPGLAKAALAGKIGDTLVDTSHVIKQDADLAIITGKNEEALELLRHDAAHVMAQAVQELYPGTQVTIGPAIEDGFFYDFSREDAFTPDDLTAIEKRMHEIVKRDLKIEREVWDRDQAVKVFGDIGEVYKVEIIKDVIPEGEEVVALAGTECGLDTAWVIRASASHNLFHPSKGARFIELLAKPGIPTIPDVSIEYLR